MAQPKEQPCQCPAESGQAAKESASSAAGVCIHRPGRRPKPPWLQTHTGMLLSSLASFRGAGLKKLKILLTSCWPVSPVLSEDRKRRQPVLVAPRWLGPPCWPASLSWTLLFFSESRLRSYRRNPDHPTCAQRVKPVPSPLLGEQLTQTWDLVTAPFSEVFLS